MSNYFIYINMIYKGKKYKKFKEFWVLAYLVSNGLGPPSPISKARSRYS